MIREGFLQRKNELDEGGRKAATRSWKNHYTVLIGPLLNFYKDKRDFQQVCIVMIISRCLLTINYIHGLWTQPICLHTLSLGTMPFVLMHVVIVVGLWIECNYCAYIMYSFPGTHAICSTSRPALPSTCLREFVRKLKTTKRERMHFDSSKQ